MDGGVARSSSWNGRGGGFFSKRSLSNYVRVVSSGASNVASSVRSAGASIVSTIADRHDDAGRDQVLWAGFDKLECEGDLVRQVLLLGYRSGFQVWDVEQADDVRQLVSRHDGCTYFLQMLKKPIASKRSEDKFEDLRPLLVVTMDGSVASLGNTSDGFGSNANGYVGGYQEPDNENQLPTNVRFYSMKIQDYVHVVKFRTAVFSIRCSPRVVAISQASQIHCFSATTLAREYTILTNPVVSLTPGSGSSGYGPLAVGSRWLAYTASPVAVSSAGRVSPQEVSHTVGISVPPNGSLVAHYAKESSKQLAAGLVTLGDMGYKKLSKCYSELLADNHGSIRQVNSDVKTNGSLSRQAPDIENAGMVIVRDIVSKSVIVQFKAHTSPISALCYDPSGTLLVTASIYGHNINVFQIMLSPKGNSGDPDANGTAIHLYKLQRGITNAVIKDISFSDDSKWVMVSSSRGTSHLYALSSRQGTEYNFRNIHGSDLISQGFSSKPSEQSLLASGAPISLSAVGRIRSGSNGLKGAVTGAAAAATGKVSPLSGAIASVFHNCKGAFLPFDDSSLWTKNYLLVFTPSGSIIQYVLRHSCGEDFVCDLSGLGAISPGMSQGTESRLVVDALQKWDVCHKRNRRDSRGDNVDIFCDNANGENNKLLQKGARRGNTVYPTDSGSDLKARQSTAETHKMYISEVELHMHEVRVPLWAKPEICFHVMEENDVDGSNPGGEIEIERISIQTLAVRSKDPIPISEYLQATKFQNPRAYSANVKKNGLTRQKSVLSEDGRLSCGSSCSSPDCLAENAGVIELQNGIDGNGWIHSPQETAEDFVHNHTNNSKLKKQLESVNNDEDLKSKVRLKTVNNIETEDDGYG